MSKPMNILESNKNLNGYSKDILEKLMSLQKESQQQVSRAKSLESEIIARMRERNAARAREELEAQLKIEREEAEREARANEAAEAAAAPAAKAEEPKAEANMEAKPEVKAEDKPEAKAENEVKAEPETGAGKDKPAEKAVPKIEVLKEEKEAEPMKAEPGKEAAKAEAQSAVKPAEAAAPAAPAAARTTPRVHRYAGSGGVRLTAEEMEARAAQSAAQARPVQPRRDDDRRQNRPDNRPPRDRRDNSMMMKDKDADAAPQQRPQRRERQDSKPSGFATFTAPRSSYENKKKRPENDNDRRNRSKGIKDKGIIVDDEFPRGSKKGRKRDRAVQAAAPIETVKIEHAVITGDTVSVKLFAEKIGKPAAEIIKKLLLLGTISNINSEIDYDTAELVASDFGITLEQKIEKTAEDVLTEDEGDDDDKLVTRPPVVTIMGHVDHGKTSLLDAIRETKVTAGEAGGITQHIGAYTIEINGRQITFLDTPGHEAFTAMRARGAQATDIAVLVVAADDGVMPQTVEAINHAKSAGVPIIVAINKMDKDTANPERVKQELTEYELIAEEWGGDTIMVPVSAVTGEGIDNILEMILLVADMQELKANPDRLAKGIIIEARLDKGRGPVATVLVQNGTLKVHDTIVAGTAYGRVRAMLDDNGVSVKEAGPAQPVEVIGFSEVPSAGDVLHAVDQDKLSKQVVEERKDKIKAEKLKSMAKVSLDDLFNQIAQGQIKDLNLVVKADVQGSVEAVKQSLEKLSNDEVRVRVIHGGVGAIRESDVMLASASNAIIIGFNVRPDASVSGAAERENVDIRLYRVIYNAIEDIEKAMKGMLAPQFREEVLGHAEVRQTFKVSSVGTIAGSYVIDGKMQRNAEMRLVRDGIVIHEGKLSSLKRFKDDAKEVSTGYECGITIENFNDVKEGDVIEAFIMVEIER